MTCSCRALSRLTKFGFPLDAAAILLIETDGLKEGAALKLSAPRRFVKTQVRVKCGWPKTIKNASCCGPARKGAFGAIGRITPSYVTQDGVVPRSQIATDSQ
jgi:glycolate oxidase